MNTYKLSCPSCNAELSPVDGIDTFYCQFCGAKIVLSGQSEAAYKAKTKMKGMEHIEHIADKKYAQRKYEFDEKLKYDSSNKKRALYTLLVGFALFFMIIFGVKLSSNKQERDLQRKVEEIQIDIINGDYDVAYVKAQSIKYTADWSNEIEEKWDNTREALIIQIINKEIEETGTSKHKLN